MKLQVSFKQPNLHFEQQTADEYYFGKESDGNLKFSHDHTYRSTIDRYEITRKTEYRLIGETDKEKIDIGLKNVFVMLCFVGDNCVQEIIVSEALIKSFLKNFIEKANRLRIYFYFKPDVHFKRYGNMIYVLNNNI